MAKSKKKNWCNNINIYDIVRHLADMCYWIDMPENECKYFVYKIVMSEQKLAEKFPVLEHDPEKYEFIIHDEYEVQDFFKQENIIMFPHLQEK